MANKTYISNTGLSINVKVGSKQQKKHIAFDPTNDGRSFFSTGSTEIQEALEKHPRYGTSFKIYCEEKAVEPAKAEEPKGEEKAIKVNGLADARTYLAETFEISRTQLRSKDSILKAAAANGVTFEGI